MKQKKVKIQFPNEGIFRKYKLPLIVLLITVFFLGIIFWVYKYYDFQNRLYLAAVDVLKEEVKHYEEASSSAQTTINSLNDQVEGQQNKINSFSCPPAPKLSCPTPTPHPTASIQTDEPVIDCKVNQNCGGGTIKLNKSVCDRSYCCSLGYGVSVLVLSQQACNDLGNDEAAAYQHGAFSHPFR